MATVWLRHVLARSARLLVGVALFSLLAACEHDQVSPPPRLIVDVYDVGIATEQRERTFHGRVVPADLTRVSFRLPGKIDHLVVQAGQQVTEGQLLAQIEDSIQRQVLADATARFQLSRRQLNRAENLHKRGALTAAQRDQLQASFRLAEANLRLAESGLSYTQVRAPFDGVVADVNKELYEAVAPGETVVTVYRNDRTDVLINIPDILPARVHQATDISTVRVQATFSGSPVEYTMGYLKSSTARHPGSQAFQFWLSMPVADTPFPPGLPVTITTDLQEAGFSTDVGLIVPLTALEAAGRANNFRAWRYEDGHVYPVPVEVARVSQRGALITGGLEEGDRIVTSALVRLSPGQTVDIRPYKQEQ